MVIYPRILSLCTGYGGLDLGLELCSPSSQVVCYVEREAYAAANLVARMEEQDLDNGPIWDDVKTFDGKPWRGAVDCVTAGYPCQPFSVAGNKLGTADPRHLWPDITRIIGEVRPQFCFFENVANHLNMGFDTVSRDLQEMGYSVAAALVTAAEVGAPHKRERLFIMAIGNCVGLKPERGKQSAQRDHTNGCGGSELANAESERSGSGGSTIRSQAKITEFKSIGSRIFPPGQDSEDPDWGNWPWPSFEPRFRRGSYGSTQWNDRLRLCGNGVVPLVAAYAFGILSHDLNIY